MKKIDKLKKIKNYLLAFILPFVLLLSVFYFKGILQNVESIIVSDLRAQHIIFLNYFKNVLLGEASLFYSFSAGMGSSMLSTIIFYCISPINLLLLLIDDIRYALLFLYVAKISLSGLTMFILLRSKSENKESFITILFSTCYALSAFAINYFFCIFWFDSLYLAPLVVLGIDKIFKTEKINLLYILSLALAIICNIQLGFGLCVFALIYFLYNFSIHYSFKKDFKKFKQVGLIFAISSLCAGAISSGALLGFGVDYANISSARDIFETSDTEIANIGYVLKNLFSVGNLKGDYYNNFEPFIYCGLIVTFFSILYLFSKDIDERKRFSAFGVIGVFFAGFFVNFINVFWHLNAPILLNFRYSIYLGLFLTILAYECYLKKQKFTKNDIIILSISLLIGFFVIIGYSYEVYVLWTFAFLVLIFSLVLFVKNKNRKFEFLLCIAVLAELGVNGYLSIYRADQIPLGEYTSYDSFNEMVSLKELDDGYRVVYDYSFVDFMNDTLYLNENSSLRYFSSVINGNLVNFFKNNYSTVGKNAYLVSAYDSPLLLSLLGEKYFYLAFDINNLIYDKVDSYEFTSIDVVHGGEITKNVYFYENPYALSLGYMIENDVSYEEGMDLVDYQNKLIKSFSGIDEDVMIRLNTEYYPDDEQCINSTFYTCNVYEITNNTNNVNTHVYVDYDMFSLANNNVKAYSDPSNKPFLLSTIDKKIWIMLEYGGPLFEDLIAVTYDDTKLINSLSALQQDMLENVEINGNVLTAEIDASKSGTLFLSIPYDNDFEIYVDGKQVEYYSLLDNTFIGLDLDEGKHDIRLKYVDGDFKWYVIASIGSIGVTFVLYYFINKAITKRKEEEERIERERLENIKAKREKKKKEKSKKVK